ncbi:helix-turn-helix transcriptional regulator [Actinomadura opuntiae]|uniref:helix-turn-helix transcriptional regulator n=1 Tax=Actinomadura sp. OS1-43 TaxID=604315 RepID=UPI00255AFC11|nr:LuxR family transcriptional regulator [Actinomadura sp. OS1-43]MDL4814469.1 LuxR family transcriptional regulator [Actinomadura sp. OS1-43]
MSGHDRLYGRDRELAAVEGLLGRTRDGHGGALTIVADAGMGKTALLDAAARNAAEGFRVLSTSGVPAEAHVSYAGLHRLLRPLSGLAAELPPAFRTALAPLTGGAAPAPFVLYSAVCELLSVAARAEPVLCRVDDAQWLDRVTLDALAFAARRVQDERLAIVFATRTQAPLTGIPHLRLPPLDEDASLRILQDAVGDALGTELAEEVVDLASGCALAVRELAGGLTAAQLSGGAVPPRALPPGSVLRTLYRRRHLRLPPGAQRLVLMVAADEWLGAPTVARAARTAGIGAREIEAARESGLLRLADHAVAGDDAVVVRDQLVRSSLWAEASRTERRAAHALLAQLLVQDWQRPSRIWHRAALSGEADDRIADELAEAASASRRAGRYGDSWRAWQRAAALTSERGARADRLLAAAADAWAGGRARRARAVLRQVRPLDQDGARAGRAELLRGGIEAGSGSPATAVPMLRDAAERLAGTDGGLALTALMWAAEAADAAGDHTAYAEIAERAANLPGGPQTPRADLMRAHLAGMAATFRGRYAEAAGLLRRAVRLGEAVADDSAAQAWAALAALALGDGRARALAAGAVASARLCGDAPAESYALAAAARCETLLGHPPVPIAACHEGLRLARATGQHGHAAEQLAALALVAAFNGDRDAAHRHLEALSGGADRRGLAGADRRGLIRAAAFGAWAPACLDLAADRPGDAAARLRLPGGAGLAHPLARLLAAPNLVEALAYTGHRAPAVHAAEDFTRWADATRTPGRLALARRCAALLADCEDEAAAHFTEALRLHESADAVFELARTELLFGARLRRGRRPRAAREHLRTALRIFERYGAAAWTGQARAELRAAGDAGPAPDPEAAAPRTAAGPGEPPALTGLTAQQAHIARMVAEGATNREIAARLLLSPRTIDHHLRNVFTRLGIRSRVELARMIR